MKNERDIVYLAALLHDIGKFWQKGDGFWNSTKYLKPEAKNISGVATNISQYGTPTHQHVYWTFQFIQNKKEIFQSLGLKVEGADGLSNLATYHHKPQSFLQGIITLADNWASGLDREKIIDNDSEEETSVEAYDVKWGKFKYKKMPLSKIFNRLSLAQQIPKRHDSEQAVYDLAQLSLERNLILGKPLGKEPKDLTAIYELLWIEFEKEFSYLPTKNYKNFADSISYLLKKYTWCTPADTSTLFDNSLYEHLKVTAAIALSLYDYWKENPNALSEDKNHRLKITEAHFPLRLWCVDFSGIQKFIYDISSKSAAKSLKGRSFYLQLLLDGIADAILNAPNVNATQSNLIYSSGGKFFLLLPNTQSVNKAVEVLEAKIKDAIWEEFKGAIYVCFGSAAWKYQPALNTDAKQIKPDILIEGKISPCFLGDLWQTVTRNASEQKNQKFRENLLDKSAFEKLFDGKYEKGGIAQICEVTGIEYPPSELVKLGDAIVSRSVQKQIEIGEDLKEFQYLIRGNNGFALLPFLRKVQITKSLPDLNSSHINHTPQDINLGFLSAQTANSLNGFGFQWYGGSDGPTYLYKGQVVPKNFEELVGIFREDRDKNNSQIKERKGNFNRLAVLRMDVDNLGKLFTNGFDKSQASFSAYATLSASLDWFFSGYLNTIRRKDSYREWVSIIYSGGDDIFAVGRWDKMIEFAHEVQYDFKAFVGRNDMSISGGLSIVSPRFPIAKAALMAGEAEDRSKDFKRKIGDIEKEKDAFSLFDIVVGWEEFPKIQEWKRKIVEWLSAGTISKGLLHKLFGYYEYGYLKNDISWKWNAAYSLARQAKDTANQAKKYALNELKDVIFTEIDKDKSFRFEAFIVACRWAELESKDKS